MDRLAPSARPAGRAALAVTSGLTALAMMCRPAGNAAP